MTQKENLCAPKVSLITTYFSSSLASFSLCLNQNGASALYCAAWKGRADVVKMLVEAKAKINLVIEVGDWKENDERTSGGGGMGGGVVEDANDDGGESFSEKRFIDQRET